MPRFEVADVREQNVDLIIIPLDSTFGNKTSIDQHQPLVSYRRAQEPLD